MLKDQDRIFQNLYNDLGPDLTSSQKRGDWVNTKEITDTVSYTHLTLPTTPYV